MCFALTFPPGATTSSCATEMCYREKYKWVLNIAECHVGITLTAWSTNFLSTCCPPVTNGHLSDIVDYSSFMGERHVLNRIVLQAVDMYTVWVSHAHLVGITTSLILVGMSLGMLSTLINETLYLATKKGVVNTIVSWVSHVHSMSITCTLRGYNRHQFLLF